MDTIKNWRFWLPILSGYSISMLCGVSDDDGKILSQRPPSIVFKIVWPILYILLGLSWVNAASQLEVDLMHGLCTFLLALWLIIFSCMGNKKLGIYIIACTISVVICCMCLHNHKMSKIILSPLLAWLLVAYQLNWHII